MTNIILDGAQWLSDLLMGPWTLVFIAVIAIFFTVLAGFFQVRRFGFIYSHTLGSVFSRKGGQGKGVLTSFQAAAISLGGTIGTGNIAGVATALSIGGPGALFWMWVLAFFGMMLKTAEITLGVHYRDADRDGNCHGGPMYYIRKGLGWTSLSKIFSIGMIINALMAATLLQPHTAGRAFAKIYGINPYWVAGFMSVVTAFVVIRGFRQIGRFCERLVPFMSILYIVGGLVIILVNVEKIPHTFLLIFKYAFAPAPAIGGFAGASIAAAIQQGVSRGMYSNEAGQGSAPMAHATAKTEHPFQQGMWGGIEVFVDTIIICSITGLVILSTGLFSGGETGIEVVISAFSTVFPENLSGLILAFSVLTFCLTTQIGFFIYYETSVSDIFGKRSMGFFKWIYLVPGVLFAGVANVDKLWLFANITVAACAIPNMIALVALHRPFMNLMRDRLEMHNRYLTDVVDRTGNYIKIP